MCWYSAEHMGRDIQNAEIGQRLCIRKMHWGDTRWVVRDDELQNKEPAPVCMLDGTRVVFRPTEDEQTAMQLTQDAEAVFRMLRHPKRDVFEFADGRQIEVNRLPGGLTFDVLVVPGKEELSSLVTARSAPQPAHEPEPADEPVLARLLHLF